MFINQAMLGPLVAARQSELKGGLGYAVHRLRNYPRASQSGPHYHGLACYIRLELLGLDRRIDFYCDL